MEQDSESEYKPEDSPNEVGMESGEPEVESAGAGAKASEVPVEAEMPEMTPSEPQVEPIISAEPEREEKVEVVRQAPQMEKPNKNRNVCLTIAIILLVIICCVCIITPLILYFWLGDYVLELFDSIFPGLVYQVGIFIF